MTTIGLSPKLYPAILAIVTGLVLVLLDEKTTGLSILLTGVGALGFGYVAPPGEVGVDIGPANDDLLDEAPAEAKPKPRKKAT